jgi:hypothetical protein
MADHTREHDDVVRRIIELQESHFEVLNNLKGENNFLSGIFPDVILLDKISKQPVFIIEVKRNGQVSNCLQQWKNIANIPATLYIIVPEAEISSAKLIGTTLGIKAKFGTYGYENDTVTSVHFES